MLHIPATIHLKTQPPRSITCSTSVMVGNHGSCLNALEWFLCSCSMCILLYHFPSSILSSLTFLFLSFYLYPTAPLFPCPCEEKSSSFFLILFLTLRTVFRLCYSGSITLCHLENDLNFLSLIILFYSFVWCHILISSLQPSNCWISLDFCQIPQIYFFSDQYYSIFRKMLSWWVVPGPRQPWRTKEHFCILQCKSEIESCISQGFLRRKKWCNIKYIWGID